MQSSRVARGSMRRWWSLPLMRSVTGMAPWMLGLSLPAAGEPLGAAVRTGAHPVMTAAAAVLPMVRRNARRLGSDGLDCSWSSIQSLQVKQLMEQQYLLYRSSVAREPTSWQIDSPNFTNFCLQLIRSRLDQPRVSPNVGHTWIHRVTNQ